MRLQQTLFRSFFITLYFFACGVASAHTNEYLDTIDGDHGGQLRMSGAYHFELVVAPGTLKIYVTDHGSQPIETAGASADAMVVTNGKKSMVKLRAAAANTFEGVGDFTLNEESTVHLKVTMPNGDAELATFTPLRKRDGKAAEGGHHHHQ